LKLVQCFTVLRRLHKHQRFFQQQHKNGADSCGDGCTQTILWTRARRLERSESESELLALVGTYGEKARGYVARIRLEYFAPGGNWGVYERD